MSTREELAGVTCPLCGGEIYQESFRCGTCGDQHNKTSLEMLRARQTPLLMLTWEALRRGYTQWGPSIESILSPTGRMRQWIQEMNSPCQPHQHDGFAILAYTPYFGHPNSKLVGVGMAVQWRTFPPPRDDWDYGVFVVPEYRRRGYGTRITVAATQIVTATGEKFRIHPHNVESVRFYESLGKGRAGVTT
jgi:RimJ/RimL family protein N-acetyltransferase